MSCAVAAKYLRVCNCYRGQPDASLPLSMTRLCFQARLLSGSEAWHVPGLMMLRTDGLGVPGLGEQVVDFLIAGLGEILVPVADAVEWFGRLRADHLGN